MNENDDENENENENENECEKDRPKNNRSKQRKDSHTTQQKSNQPTKQKRINFQNTYILQTIYPDTPFQLAVQNKTKISLYSAICLNPYQSPELKQKIQLQIRWII